MNTLLLKPECAELLRKLKRDSNETVTCIFGDHIQFEKLDEMYLLPKDLMRIVYEYFNDKMIVKCVVKKDSYGMRILFNINDNDNRVTYQYDVSCELLEVITKKFHQQDDSIIIIYTPFTFFNLSRLYYHYAVNNNLSFPFAHYNSSAIVDNNKYTIAYGNTMYVAEIRNHEVLKRRINVMKQLIDIIKKLCE